MCHDCLERRIASLEFTTKNACTILMTMYYKKVLKQRLGYSGLCKDCYYLKGQKSLHQIHITKVSINLYILTICLFVCCSAGNRIQYCTPGLHPCPGSRFWFFWLIHNTVQDQSAHPWHRKSSQSKHITIFIISAIENFQVAFFSKSIWWASSRLMLVCIPIRTFKKYMEAVNVIL